MVGGFSANPHAWAVLLTLACVSAAFTGVVAVYRRVRGREQVFNWTFRTWLAFTVLFGGWFWVESEPRRATSALYDQVVADAGLEGTPSLGGGRIEDFDTPCEGAEGRGFYTSARWQRTEPENADLRDGVPLQVFAEVEEVASSLEANGWSVRRVEGRFGLAAFVYAESDHGYLAVSTGTSGGRYGIQMTTDDCRGPFLDRQAAIDAQNATDPGSVVFVDSFVDE